MKNKAYLPGSFPSLLFSADADKAGNGETLTPDSTANIPSSSTPKPTLNDIETTPDPVPISKRDTIPFEPGQLYAAAYLGYQTIEGLDYYAWSNIHPSLITIPVEWDFTVPYVLLYAPDISGEAAEFLNRLKDAVQE